MVSIDRTDVVGIASGRRALQVLLRFLAAGARGFGAALLDTGMSFSRSMNHRPAGPGGDFVCQTADIGTSRPPGGTFSIDSGLRRPSSRSLRTAWSGMPPQPR